MKRLVYVFLISTLFFGCSPKDSEKLDLESYIWKLNISLPKEYLLVRYITEKTFIQKDTSNNGQFIKYTLYTDSSEVFSYAILHTDDSSNTRYITMIHHELFEKTGCSKKEKYSTYFIKVFKEQESVIEEITDKIFMNENINVDVTKINNNCSKIKPIVTYDTISLSLNKDLALFIWKNYKYKLDNNSDNPLFSLSNCSNYCMDINLIEADLHNLTKLDYTLNDTLVYIYNKYKTISKIKAELPNKTVYEFYYNNFPNEVTSQDNLFCCKVTNKSNSDYNFFEKGVFKYRVNYNQDTFYIKPSFDELFRDTSNIDMYNLSQKSFNLFSISNNSVTYALFPGILKYAKQTESALSTFSMKEKDFKIKEWPIRGTLTTYKNNGELKYIRVSFSQTEWQGVDIDICIKKGKIVYTKTLSLSSVNRGLDGSGMQVISTYLSENKERLYQDEKLIGWIDRPLFTQQEFPYNIDSYASKIVPEISFSNDLGELESEYPPQYWFEFSKSKLSLEKFDEQYKLK